MTEVSFGWKKKKLLNIFDHIYKETHNIKTLSLKYLDRAWQLNYVCEYKLSVHNVCRTSL